jgi:hypothetical protein
MWFQWGNRIKFPNLFALLAGKPGDRKGDCIRLARQIADKRLPANAFVSEDLSPHMLFDEYDEENDGRPDKLAIVDDANLILSEWQKTIRGGRGASRILNLHECGPLTRRARRHKKKETQAEWYRLPNGFWTAERPRLTRRVISQTSTSMVLGATFNVACFQSRAIRAAMARRFLYYVADWSGGTIDHPTRYDLKQAAAYLGLLETFDSGALVFACAAEKLWVDFLHDNGARIAGIDAKKEAELSRLDNAPWQTLSIAMIFQACVCAKQAMELQLISEEVLRLAIDHVDASLEAANFLDTIADRESIVGNAAILLAKIRKDFPDRSRQGWILLRRSEITARYAPHPGRAGAWTAKDIFLELIAALVRQGEARLYEKRGKREIYAFQRHGDPPVELVELVEQGIRARGDEPGARSLRRSSQTLRHYIQLTEVESVFSHPKERTQSASDLAPDPAACRRTQSDCLPGLLFVDLSGT